MLLLDLGSQQGVSAGGQKVKVVLAAATWMNPHMLVLDEPSNYLDRESLGALADAIKEFGGGVVMISHNSGEPMLPFCPPAHVLQQAVAADQGCPSLLLKMSWMPARCLCFSACEMLLGPWELQMLSCVCADACRVHQRAVPGEVAHGGRQAAGHRPV